MRGVSLFASIISIAVISWLINNKTVQASGSQVRSMSAPISSKESGYSHLTGKIGGKYDVTMDISINNSPVFYYTIENATASYSYNNSLQPITLFGTFKDDSLNFVAGNTEDTVPEYFKGKYINGTYTGEWTHGNKKLPFSFKSDLSGSVPFDAFLYCDSSRLIPKRADMQALFEYNLCIITDQRYKVLGKLLYQAYCGLSTLSEIKDSVKREAKDFFVMYHDGLQFYLADTNRIGMENYESHTFSEVIFNADSMLVIEMYHYEYTGGAHGMSYRTFVSLNTATANPIKLEDFLIESDTGLVKKLLENKVRKYKQIPDSLSLQESGLFVTNNDIPFAANYYITPGGVMFVYNVYEIASYADGMTYLFVPFKEIAGSIRRQSWMKF